MSAVILLDERLANRMAQTVVDDLRAVLARHAPAIERIAETARLADPDSDATPGSAAAYLAGLVFAETVYANADRDPTALCRERLDNILRQDRDTLLGIHARARGLYRPWQPEDGER